MREGAELNGFNDDTESEWEGWAWSEQWCGGGSVGKDEGFTLSGGESEAWPWKVLMLPSV